MGVPAYQEISVKNMYADALKDEMLVNAISGMKKIHKLINEVTFII